MCGLARVQSVTPTQIICNMTQGVGQDLRFRVTVNGLQSPVSEDAFNYARTLPFLSSIPCPLRSHARLLATAGPSLLPVVPDA